MEFSGENKEELPKTHTYGIETELKDAFKTGCTFGGWYTTSDCKSGSGPVNILAAGAYTEKDEKIVLYAKWTPNTYSVTYTENGGTIADKEKYTSYTYGEGLTLPKPTKTGYTFGGWYTDSACDGEPVTSITKTDTGEKTYYAKWTVNTYEITYKDQGNVGFSGTHEGTPPSRHTYGKDTELGTASKTGYEFGGWYTTSDCGGNPVTRLLADSYTEEIILYAKWTANTYEVTYVYEGATGGNDKTGKEVTYGEAYGDLPEPVKTDYVFAGWHTEPDGKGQNVESTTNVTIADDHKLYAYWTDELYTVTYDYQGATGEDTVKSKSVAYGSTYGDLPEPTRKGYEFAGWYTAAENGERVTSGTDVLLKKDHTLYARWEDHTAPVIGTLKYNYEPKFFLDWLIGKDSLVITVPVTEEGSGADKITYVVTKTGESPQEEEEATIQNNKATITVNADFKGTIKIDCVDNAGNAATSVMVGPTGNGLIVEDKAPAISFEMKGGTLREDGCYGSAPAVEVTVADDIVLADTNENAVSSGLASITYRIDNDNESGTEQTVTGDFTQGIVTQHSFTISPEEIPIGISTITVIVEDNAGNISEEKLLVKIRGNVEVKAESGENAPKVNLPMGEEELEDAVLTEQERRELEEGKGIKISLIVKDISSTVSAEEVQEIEKGASNYTVGQYLDISMMKTVTVNGVAGEPSPIHNISKPIRVVIDIPLELKGEKHRDYAVVRLHEGQTTILEDMENPDDPDTITIETDRFSTYAIVYAEITGGELNPSPSTSPEPTPSAPAKPTPSTSPKLTPSATPPAAIIPKKEQEKNSITMMAGLKVSQTGKKISVKWGRVGEADGYQVYVQYCGKKFTSKPAKTVKGASVTKSTVTKINSKKLNLMKNYKVYIAAYKTVTGKKAVLGKTLIGHIVGKNNKAYTNVKQVKLAKSKFTIKAGKSVRIKAKTVLVDKTKKQLTDAHAKELRYKSTDTSVVTVSASGKVTAKGKGTCIVYVYARNGYAKKVTVKVK
ncbi:MAG: InlB B-repeat-containing protein [Lachnospiraceae bacterium]|nr:InlB B-repeat-containing protein [Lachnospiraceae bacterium]